MVRYNPSVIHPAGHYPIMKFVVLSTICILLFTFITHGDGTKAYGTNTGDVRRYERYHYEALKRGKRAGGQRESIIIEINRFGSETLLTVQTQRINNYEIVRLTLNQKGEVISGLRETVYHTEEQIHQERIWRNDQTVYVERLFTSHVRTKSFTIPKPVSLVVDASLIYLLRSFPFDTNVVRDFFMVDFSQFAITVTARQIGIETVNVPAGEFDCYHIEVMVNRFILLPKIHFWVTKDPPHFLVKHSGKRGPFSPHYISALVSKN